MQGVGGTNPFDNVMGMAPVHAADATEQTKLDNILSEHMSQIQGILNDQMQPGGNVDAQGALNRLENAGMRALENLQRPGGRGTNPGSDVI